MRYADLPEYTLTRDFTVNKSNVFENYTNGTEYSDIFDGNPETFMTFENGAEIIVNFDSPKAFGGFYIDGENTEIYYLDLDANKLVPFDKTPVKTDKLVFKISGENTVVRDIAAFCTDYCDELLSDENILKNYPFSFDGKTISEGNILLPAVLCKYINLTWESSDESVIDLFGNVYAPQKTTTVTLTAQIPGGAKRVCTVTVQAKKVVDKKGTGSGGGSGSSSGLNYSKPANTLPAAKPDLPPTAAQLPFSDVGSSYWCYDTIKYLYENEIINGKTETEFCPEDFVTRAEFVKMLVAAGDISADDNEISFKDVKKSDWYYTYVKTAFNAEIITGTGENIFGADENITREDLCVMLGRALRFENTSEFEAAFSDSDEISDYAKGYVAQMSKEGVISGYSDGTFRPQNCATRSECAKIIYSYIKLTGRSK